MEELAPSTSPELKDYLAVLKYRKWLVVATTAVVFLVVMAYTLSETRSYTSGARVLVEAFPTPPGDSPPTPNLNTEAGLVHSAAVAATVQSSLNLSESPDSLLTGLDVFVEPQTELLDVRYTDAVPARAQRLAEGFATAYLDFRRQQALQFLATENPLTPGHKLRLGGDGEGVGKVVQAADLPVSPSSPKPIENGVVGFVVGLALGIFAAFLRERFDDRLRGVDDLEQWGGAPVLAVVPKLKWKRRGEAKLITLEDPRSWGSEAYRALRTSIRLGARDQELKTMLVTSPEAAEGKTTTVANLGVVTAESGKRVVLVSADLRKPRLHQFFGLSNEYGLVDVVRGERALFEALKPTRVDGLYLLPCGPPPAYPAELLESAEVSEILRLLRAAFDYVVLDAAPAFVVADSFTLASQVDGVFVVAHAQHTNRSSIGHARDQLEQAGIRIVGTVMNSFDPGRAGDSYYHKSYYSHYGQGPGSNGAVGANGHHAPSLLRRRRTRVG
ncbi:MAG: polysaccharide biosynthesis tyrosine autokinase [Solirubrobacterales bacterium]|nr:polysaccharide biosynthesis tyrosine autokinase [Solirubrobacterales bacterium]